MSTIRRLAVCVFLVAFHAGAAVLPPGNYPFRTYGAEAGLGNLSVMKLAQDRDGFLWVATQDGMYRYDGSTFTRFGLEQGLPSTFVTHLVTRGGVLWVSTAGGVARFDGIRFVHERAIAAANAITLDAANRLWAATAQGLFVETAPHQFTIINGWRGGEATGVWSSASGEVWAASSGAVGRLARGAWTWWS